MSLEIIDSRLQLPGANKSRVKSCPLQHTCLCSPRMGLQGWLRCCIIHHETTHDWCILQETAWGTSKLWFLKPTFSKVPTWGPFLPEASFGLRVLSLPACVRVSVNHELVCAITRHNFQLKSPNLDQKMQNILLKVPNVLGTDWAWPSRSNFTLLKNYVYLHRFCIFEIFVRHVCLTAPHPTWLRTHSLTTTCPPTGSRDRLWNCLYVYLGETIGVSANLDSAIGTQFYKLLSVFTRGQLWPSGIVVACVCLCVCVYVCVCVRQSWVCPRDNSSPV